MRHWRGFIDQTNLLLFRKWCILSPPRSSLIKPSLKGGVAVVRQEHLANVERR